ncbi:TonB-dependent receptor plug domain-containing protein [candidate division KSB1 bacterium]|nr:TonB-dependent receptor plug domain-containing protein [candidate division KSB1 bacterium]
MYSKKVGIRLFFTFAIMLLLSSFVLAQTTGKIEGTVEDAEGQQLVGANVYLQGTTLGSSTDRDGAFTIESVPPGNYTIQVRFLGYKTAVAEVQVTAGETVTRNFTLESDVLDMEALVVTGTINPLKKIESSVAIATVNKQEIERRAPRNTADLLKAIPGFYVESSGGEGGNNLFARGIPADGSFRYVSLQEDGLPVFEDGELMFGNADLFLRVDETVDRMEAVRGGTASIFASNAPGGIINFISKTGGNKLGGVAKLTLGDYGLYRTDFNIGGPMSENWRFNIGGFYRHDDGVRPPGFTANQGGQIKGNFTRLLGDGYFRVNFKFLDDKNIFYLPIPLKNPDDPEAIEGFDANYGTMTSIDMNYLSVPTPKGESFEKNLDNGMHPQIKALGGEFFYEFDNGWTVKNAFRYTDTNEEFNAIFSLSDPFLASAYAADIMGGVEGAASYQYRFARSGDVITNPDDLNGNGLVAEVGWWSVSLPMSNFANDLQFSKSFGNHNLTLGFYHTDWKVNSLWYWQDVLAEVQGGQDDNTRALDLVLMDGAGQEVVSVTHNGLSRIGSTYNRYKLDAVSKALYLNDEFMLNDQLRFDAGIRYEFGRVNGFTENSEEFDLGDETTLADDNVLYGNGTFNPYDWDYDEIAFSVGANFKMSEGMAFFGRGSKGFRTPDDQHFVFNAPGSYKVEDVLQFEGGIKYASPHLAVFASLFAIQFENIPFSDEVVEEGEIVRAFRFANSQTLGAELEAIVQFGNFGLDLTATLQDPKYKDYLIFDYDDPQAEPTELDFTDNQVRRIPRIFGEVAPSYKLGDLNIYASYRFFGERYVDDANNNKLPAWAAINAGVSYRLGDFLLALNGANLTNTIGLTEGNPRAGQVIGAVKDIYMARPILGRTFTTSITYNF